MRGIESHAPGRPSANLPLRLLGVLLLVIGAGGAPAAQAPGPQADKTPPASLRIVVLEGEAGVNIIDQKTAVAPIVEVRDRNDLPVVGAQVTFLIRSGVGRATLNNGLRQVTLTTNAAGRATVAVNPVARGAIQLQVNAAYQGQTAAATITQTNFATAAQAASASGAGSGGAGGGGAGGGAGGGLSTAAIAGIAGAGVAGGLVATKALSKANPCTFGVNPATLTVGSGATSSSVSVAASPEDCDSETAAWTASSNAAFVTVSPTSGTRSGTVTVAVAANASAVPRSATVTVAGQTVTITQAPVCTFTVSPTTAGPVANAGGTVSISVTVGPSGCSPSTWAATSNAAFLTVSPASGTGNGAVTVTAAANTSASRTGTVTVAGQTVTITQGAAGVNVTGRWTMPGRSPLVITLTQATGSSSFTGTVAAGSVPEFSWSGGSVTGTISGTAVRFVITLNRNDGCNDSLDISATVNAAGTSMSGTLTETWCAGSVSAPISIARS
jgi:hypothetical protein